jgi:hypothetical protein
MEADPAPGGNRRCTLPLLKVPNLSYSGRAVLRSKALLAVCFVTTAMASAAAAAGPIDFIAFLDGALRRVNSGTDVPILLPDTVPATVPQARMKIRTTASPDRYDFEIALTRNCRHGSACEIGDFSARKGGHAGPKGGRRDLAKSITLLSGFHGFYRLTTRPEIEWVESGVLYDIRWKSSPGHARQTIVELANLAIRGGVRE